MDQSSSSSYYSRRVVDSHNHHHHHPNHPHHPGGYRHEEPYYVDYTSSSNPHFLPMLAHTQQTHGGGGYFHPNASLGPSRNGLHHYYNPNASMMSTTKRRTYSEPAEATFKNPKKWQSVYTEHQIPTMQGIGCNCSTCKAVLLVADKRSVSASPSTTSLKGHHPVKHSKKATAPLKLGDRVLLRDDRCGVVRWVGVLDNPHGEVFEDDQAAEDSHEHSHVGVQLDSPTGTHDGVFRGKRYFQCTPNHGVMAHFKDVLFVKTRNEIYFRPLHQDMSKASPRKPPVLAPLPQQKRPSMQRDDLGEDGNASYSSLLQPSSSSPTKTQSHLLAPLNSNSSRSSFATQRLRIAQELGAEYLKEQETLEEERSRNPPVSEPRLVNQSHDEEGGLPSGSHVDDDHEALDGVDEDKYNRTVAALNEELQELLLKDDEAN